MVRRRILAAMIRSLVVLSCAIMLSRVTIAQECGLSTFTQVTDDFFYAATGDQGAVGDVVAVEVSLQVNVLRPWLAGFAVVGCFDADKLELLDPVAYSDALEDLAFFSYFSHLGQGL